MRLLAAMVAVGTSSLYSYIEAFWPEPDWHSGVNWPPDVFALTNLVLDHTEAYRFVVAPPPERHWPPFADWEARLQRTADAWRQTPDEPPPLVCQLWQTLCRGRDVPLGEIRSGAAWEIAAALLTLHALADEACAAIGSAHGNAFERRAWELLEAHGSLSRFSSSRLRIVPKTNFSPRGITVRSLSRHLALCYEAVDVAWRGVAPTAAGARRDYKIVLLPWPLWVRGSDFRPVPTERIENMDGDRFGFFEFAPEGSLDCELVASLLAAAGQADAVVLPECAVDSPSLAALQATVSEHGVTFLIAGARELPGAGLGRNYLHLAVRAEHGWVSFEQDKHHRWCLDEGQIRQYHLTRSLQANKLWWEAIDLRERRLYIVDVGGGITTAPMVCEDLASLDEVADHVRRIGPSLVVAVLLDGPQLAGRWPCRYSGVLTDDPGSAVLTLTSFGMAARSRPPGRRRSRVVAHWNSRVDGPQEIELARGAAGVLLTVEIDDSTVWTADGRCHEDVPRLRLAEVRQLRA